VIIPGISADIRSPGRAFGTGVDDPLFSSLTAGLLCALLFMLLNPFLALFLMALVSLYWRVPRLMFVLSAAPSFALFFFQREYGMDWYPGVSGDDVPSYISLYEGNYGYSLGDVWERFFVVPNGNEVLWHMPWSILLNDFAADEDTFVFLHYLANFVALFITMRLLSKRYWIVFAVVYFFLTPIAVDGIAHIWRQQLAFSMFVSGMALRYGRNSRAGSWLIHLSPLMHVSLVFFLIVYWVFLLLRRINAFDHKLRFVLLLGVLMTVVPVTSSIAVGVLDSLGMARIMSFFETGEGSKLRVYLLLIGYALPMLVTFFWLRTDDMNRLILLLCFAVFSIVLALPGANGIYDRLLMFSLPLMGIYFYRCLLDNFPLGWRAPVLVAIFAMGCYRLYLPTREGNGVMTFLADGHAFDPSMGLVRLLTGF
jgi:hypothetical protein